VDNRIGNGLTESLKGYFIDVLPVHVFDFTAEVKMFFKKKD
jgi:hypothetical protein